MGSNAPPVSTQNVLGAGHLCGSSTPAALSPFLTSPPIGDHPVESRSANVDRQGLNPLSGEFLFQPNRVLGLESPGPEHRLGSGGLARTMWQISCVVASTTNLSPTSFLLFTAFSIRPEQ